MRLMVLLLCLLSSKIVCADPKNAKVLNGLMADVSSVLATKNVQDIGFGLYLNGATLSFNGKSVSKGTSTNPQSDMVDYHVSTFCSPNIKSEVTGLACQASYGDDSSTMELGDIKVASLLGPVVYDQLMDVAAQQFIRNLVQPFPSTTWNMMMATKNNGIVSEDNKDNNKRSAYANALAQQALYDVARYSLNNSYGSRLSNESFNKYSSAVSSSSVSTLSVMQAEAGKWYANADFTSSDYSSDTSLLQAMAQMQSFQLWMGFQQYKQFERIETLLAAVLANSVNNSVATSNAMRK